VIGGIEQWAENLANRQPENVKVIVVTGRVEGQPNVEARGRVLIFRKSIFSLRDLSHSSRFYILGAFPLVLFGSILAARKDKINLVHCHGFLSAVMGYFLSFFTGTPFLGTEQSTGWAGSWFRGLIYRRAELCIAASKAVGKEFESIGVDRSKIRIIPNGVDFSIFSNVRGPTPYIPRGEQKVFNILSVGRLEKVKGHKYLIDAFIGIKKEIPNAKLTIVGDGLLAEDLKSKIKELSLDGDIYLVGEVPHSDLPKYYAYADVFVMPSISEGFGIAVIEAMASGVPVVASRVGGLIDIIEENNTGLLVKPENSSEIKEAVCFLKNNPVKAEEFSKNALLKSREYSWDKVARSVGDLYSELVTKDFSKKILFATSIFTPDIGGPAVYAEKLREELISIGYEIEVAKGKDSRSLLRLCQKAKNSGVIYALTSSPRILAPALLASKFSGKKIVVRLGGDYIWERAMEKRRVDCSLSSFYRDNRLTVLEKVVAYFIASMLKRVDGVIFTTEFQKEIYNKYYKLKASNVSVIENAYPRFESGKSRSFPNEPLKIIYAGRIIWLKNLHSLIRALSRLKRDYKENILLEITGEGPDLGNLIEEARSRGVSESIIFAAALPHEEILEKLKMAWIAVLPSYSEVSPNFALEACAARTPIILTKECGLSAGIKDKLITFDPFDENSLVLAMEKMLDRNEWTKYQKELMELNLDRSYKEVAEEHNKLFQNL